MKKIPILLFLSYFFCNYLFGQTTGQEAVLLNPQLAAMLDTIYTDDQEDRLQINTIGKKHGWDSEALKAHLKRIEVKDSVNSIKVEKILDTYGWPGADCVGTKGNTALFLVVQHARLNLQEKYLPLMREAVSKGNARGKDLAFLEDRVALRKGEKQIYGTQIAPDPETGNYLILPLIDPANVNKRRAELKLSTFEDYIADFGLTWNVEAYQQQLPELVKRHSAYLKNKANKQLRNENQKHHKF
ncbi:DUF6624 domain-containing protein [uncultured Draconibacterium sp.]|uniref:DUF6624 domain-containing protein n=1 Tax=uncultured Draconibacterium sp. TaxID=1573823 RepID=UPI0025D9589C|nr:DUF6624 domain-containing protein [uncultured Draconibacterium sp.]